MPEKQDNLIEKITEKTPAGPSRREMFQAGAALAIPALLGSMEVKAATVGPLKAGPDIYQSNGVEPVINCRGTFTIIGASTELPEVRAAQDAASQHYVQMDELAEGVGRRLAEITGAEWGMVSSGCAAGLKHVTAGCVAGGNPEKLLRIPDLTGLDKTEVIIPRSSRSVYDHAIRNIGVKIVMINTIDELEHAINPKTAMIYMSAGGATQSGPLALENVVKIAKPHNIPILVDAAAEVLTIPNVHLAKGATIVAYSGGKAICGPQCAGLLLGRKDILQSAWQASAPHHGPGRDNKVGREETLGMLAAVEAWVTRDHKAEWQKWLGYLDTISKRVSSIESVKTEVREPKQLSNQSPTLTVTWDPAKLNITGEDLGEIVARTKPRIALAAGGGGVGRGATAPPEGDVGAVTITSWMMRPGDDKTVADRLHQLLTEKRAPKSKTVTPPATNLSGRWDVDVEFFSSKSRHTIILEQNGNQLQGTHKGDFTVRDIYGTIEGDKVVLRSIERSIPGDNISFTFSGKATSDGFSGPIHLGEYLTAKYTAKKYAFPQQRGTILVPNGPPLAN